MGLCGGVGAVWKNAGLDRSPLPAIQRLVERCLLEGTVRGSVVW